MFFLALTTMLSRCYTFSSNRPRYRTEGTLDARQRDYDPRARNVPSARREGLRKERAVREHRRVRRGYLAARARGADGRHGRGRAVHEREPRLRDDDVEAARSARAGRAFAVPGRQVHGE